MGSVRGGAVYLSCSYRIPFYSFILSYAVLFYPVLFYSILFYAIACYSMQLYPILPLIMYLILFLIDSNLVQSDLTTGIKSYLIQFNLICAEFFLVRRGIVGVGIRTFCHLFSKLFCRPPMTDLVPKPWRRAEQVDCKVAETRCDSPLLLQPADTVALL